MHLYQVSKTSWSPDNIVSNRDSMLTSEVCKKVMNLKGTWLKVSSERHPQTDGPSEIMNLTAENIYVVISRMIKII